MDFGSPLEQISPSGIPELVEGHTDFRELFQYGEATISAEFWSFLGHQVLSELGLASFLDVVVPDSSVVFSFGVGCQHLFILLGMVVTTSHVVYSVGV